MRVEEGEVSGERRVRAAEAPEGGWGYLVIVAMVFGFVATFGVMSSLGLMFGDFLAGLGLQTKALTMLPSFFYIAFSPVGMFANFLLNRYSVRWVGVVGAVLFCTGGVALIFVRSLNELLIAYSLLQGMGFGLVLPALYTTFNRYFVRRRVTMMGLVGSLVGLVSVGLPVLIEYLKYRYGFRGCMAIMAALNLHVLFGALALHPVEWHQKVVQKDVSVELAHHPNEKEKFLEQDSEAITVAEHPEPAKPIWMKIVDFLDLTLLYDPIYANICVGMALTLFSDVSFFTIQPSYMYGLGLSKMDAALVVSIGAGADLFSRIFVTVASSCVQFKSRQLFLAGAIGTIGSQLAFLSVSSFVGLASLTAILGFFRAWIHIPIGIVFADYLTPKRFPAGYGLFMFVQGIVMFAMGPLIGWVRDYTQSFPITFNCITLAMAACAVPWSIEMLVVRCRQKEANHHERRTSAGSMVKA